MLLALEACAQILQQPGAPVGDGQQSPNSQLRERTCSPADYGDPSADCVSSPRSQTEYNSSYSSDANPDPFRQPIIDTSPYDRARSTEQQQPRAPLAEPIRFEKEPPNAFQKYVQRATGALLPIFGASLFEHVPSTFAPLDRAPVSVDYSISPGDELQVSIWGKLNFSRLLSVSRNGQVILPYAGPIGVEGMTYAQAAAVIKGALDHYYKDFNVTVTLARLHSIQVFIVGDARRPGSYTVSSMSTLVNAIFVSGGPSARGSMRDIQLKRGAQPVRHFDLYRLLIDGDKSQDVTLTAGDVIFFPAAGPRVAFTGSIEHEAVYELTEHTPLQDALKYAGGLTSLAFSEKALVERVNGREGLRELQVALDGAGLATELHNGDIVRLLPVVERFSNAVTLRGNVANPGRFVWKPGMRLRDLIPDRESLLTRDYWKARNALGNSTDNSESETPDGQNAKPVATMEKLAPHGDSSLGAATGPDDVPAVKLFKPSLEVQPAVPEINWHYAVIERTDKATLQTQLLPFDLGRLLAAPEDDVNLELQPGDVVTIFSKADFSLPHSQQAAQVRIEGEVAMAGVYTLMPGETLRHVLSRAGGLTPAAYLFGAQLTRESTRREQQKRYDDFINQLEREADLAASNLSSRVTSPQQAATAQTSLASQKGLIETMRKISMNGRIVLNVKPDDHTVAAFPDLPLENGDRLYIPNQPSTVNVIGTVYEQASFLYSDEYHVSDYLKKAGGPSRDADRSNIFIVRADGSVVSRKTTSTLFANNFASQPMFPGDTLVVPTYLNRGTFVRSLIDWSQILSNFGLGAAAINVLH